MERGSGILMHIASLPGKYGIGTFGKEAYNFADFLKKSGQKYWQILPLGQTSYGDSPYQSFSAFAGNPYFIDFDILEQEGLLNKADYENINWGDNTEKINYSLLFVEKYKVLRKAFKNFKGKEDSEIEKFKEEQSLWLEDYSLYMAIKNHFGMKSWQQWDEDIKFRHSDSVKRYTKELNEEIEFWIFLQYHFFKQWQALKAYVNKQGIEIIGDIPIYVAEDSADCWANPKAFMFDPDTLKPTKVSGCPPDSFAITGQLWGNPIYNWEYHEETEYSWWIDRMRESLKIYDVLRIDHFRGFESYWSVPAEDKTAENGEWVKGPGIKLFDAIKEELGELNIIAEDLGFMTDEVIAFRKATGFPGMKVLQFGFGGPDSSYLPHNFEDRKWVVYTGTHDNDTFRGWYEKTGSKQETNFARKYLYLNKKEGYNWGFIRGVWSSIGDTAIALMQDFLNLGNEARINVPSTLGNNWTWRLKEGLLTDKLAEKIYYITKTYGRCE
ncbi:4-alpha-glucanotransferase [Inconstantimicrobium mannanitabidum]|uniref:4-alpha-glucanotransferase n=1 Tax=Inconstantimicrobium mannanitabidum TaxID=1604901 RepID=A0ACB5REP4_9CLOT|nr:4-alpha-glucanotransferase [Clostridium sp. TW13]GKX67249.1 4-alpha-glucanotransferase [Clostridium sp. TW13]